MRKRRFFVCLFVMGVNSKGKLVAVLVPASWFVLDLSLLVAISSELTVDPGRYTSYPECVRSELGRARDRALGSGASNSFDVVRFCEKLLAPSMTVPMKEPSKEVYRSEDVKPPMAPPPGLRSESELYSFCNKEFEKSLAKSNPWPSDSYRWGLESRYGADRLSEPVGLLLKRVGEQAEQGYKEALDALGSKLPECKGVRVRLTVGEFTKRLSREFITRYCTLKYSADNLNACYSFYRESFGDAL